jgi:mono/diheme cytochrome c family protein
MKLYPTFFAFVAVLSFTAGRCPAAEPPSNAVATAPVYVPDYTHANEPLPDGVIAWDNLIQTADATNGQDFARFTFNLTNVDCVVNRRLTTNLTILTRVTAITNASHWHKTLAYTTNRTTVTNTVWITNSITPMTVTILDVHPSCGCTTAELPPRPWRIPAGSNGQIKVSVNLEGKTEMAGSLFKTVSISTDKGRKDLMIRINVLPPPPITPQSEAERAKGIASSKIDRQAVFKGDCASCHTKKIPGKYSQALYAAACTICHEGPSRATMVPDLHQLKDPTNEEFWRTWITAGKAGTLMPAFASSQGGPLNDLQIASLAAYLNSIYPSHVPPAAAK